MRLDELGQLAATVCTLAGHPEGAAALTLIGQVLERMHGDGEHHTTPDELTAIEAKVAAARARALAANPR